MSDSELHSWFVLNASKVFLIKTICNQVHLSPGQLFKPGYMIWRDGDDTIRIRQDFPLQSLVPAPGPRG